MAAAAAPLPGRVRPVVLIVDDDSGMRESFRLILEEEYELVEAEDGQGALEAARRSQLDLVLLDVRLPDMDGLAVLERLKALDPDLEVILITAVKNVRSAVTAMKLGAFDYLTKPFEDDEVLAVVHRALERRALQREVTLLRSELARRDEPEGIVGQSPAIQRLLQVITQVARTDVTVLVTGESGTGKELVARAIHRQSARRDRPFVPVTPAAIPDALLESELFGHERGAFTGATQRKLGKFELAQGGTLFLDEIGSLKPDLQVKLLRAIQEREIERVGGVSRLKIDVRIVAATNADLRRAVASGAFRDDLYYRLNVVPVHVPPLRERRGDIPALVEHFLRKAAARSGKRVTALAPDVLRTLGDYHWPGNVRELENLVERFVVLAEGPVVEARDLPLDLLLGDPTPPCDQPAGLPLTDALENFERELFRRVLERVGWNQSEAARILGIHRNTVKAKMARWFKDAPEG
jgi:DNA-binding NtrC family response regulator